MPQMSWALSKQCWMYLHTHNQNLGNMNESCFLTYPHTLRHSAKQRSLAPQQQDQQGPDSPKLATRQEIFLPKLATRQEIFLEAGLFKAQLQQTTTWSATRRSATEHAQSNQNHYRTTIFKKISWKRKWHFILFACWNRLHKTNIPQSLQLINNPSVP